MLITGEQVVKYWFCEKLKTLTQHLKDLLQVHCYLMITFRTFDIL